jgi:hypothetical protein
VTHILGLPLYSEGFLSFSHSKNAASIGSTQRMSREREREREREQDGRDEPKDLLMGDHALNS